MSNETAHDEAYILGRSFSANARSVQNVKEALAGPGLQGWVNHSLTFQRCRLNLQYFLWKDGGFSLHPNIPADREGMQVAEIGVGTGYGFI